MTATHTPGPWNIHEGIDYRHVYGGEFNDSENPIAEVDSSPENAILIKSAPDLLEALHHIGYEPLTGDMEASAEKCLDEVVRIARAAIAKMEGGAA